MKKISIEMKNGKVNEFNHRGRAGGSYTISIRYEGDFAIVKDEWGNETAFPSQDIEKVETEQFRSW
jgi:hypothetical protein